jgi:hypothetical protein
MALGIRMVLSLKMMQQHSLMELEG